MNWKHLLYIIPLCLFIGFLLTYYMIFYNDHLLFNIAMNCITEQNFNQTLPEYLLERGLI